jgi:molybdate transport system substrate-binding protein
MRRRLLHTLLGIWAALAGVAVTVAAQAPRDTLTVFAAADLGLAFPEIASLFQAQRGAAVNFVFGSTGNLALQIQNGAPADVFFAANVSYVDRLIAQGSLVAGTKTLYARGRIVVAVPRGSSIGSPGLRDLLRPEVRRIAIANPDHAPYGIAAREALESAGLWDSVQPKLVLGDNIRQTLQYVQSGAVDAGIVALSVANVPEIRFAPIPDSLHQPIEQAAAVTRASRLARIGADFIAFVTGPAGWPVMERNGFIRPRSR